MSFITVTAIETQTVIETFMITALYQTTISAIPGQTITISTPAPIITSETLVDSMTQPFETLTISEIEIFLQGPRGDIWTTFAIDLTPSNSAPTQSNIPGPQIIVGAPDNGWNSWSQSQKGGVCAGPILFVMLVVFLIWCIRTRRRQWVAYNSGSMTPAQGQVVFTGQSHPRWG